MNLMSSLAEMDKGALRKRRRYYLSACYMSAVFLAPCLYKTYSMFMADRSSHAMMFGFLTLVFLVCSVATLVLSKIVDLALMSKIEGGHRATHER
jgi:hypothetical protein